jgi:hypothetical protein
MLKIAFSDLMLRFRTAVQLIGQIPLANKFFEVRKIRLINI